MVNSSRLGEFEALILFAIIRLEPNAYGVTVRREIESRTDRTASMGSVYAGLERLERKGFVSTSISPSRPEPGGRWKKMFSASTAGREALRDYRVRVNQMIDGVSLGVEPSGT